MQHIAMILPIFLILTVPCAAFPEIGDEFRATIESVQIRDKSGSVIGSGDVGETILIQSPITINKLDGYDSEYTSTKLSTQSLFRHQALPRIHRRIVHVDLFLQL